MDSNTATKPLVFISANKEDYSWRERLKEKLQAYDNEVEWWDDSRIRAGDRWYEEILAAIERANVAVVLLSPNYLSSDTATSELEVLGNLSKTRKLKLFPVLLRECLWKQVEFLRSIQIWSMAQPIADLSDEAADAELEKIARAVSDIARQNPRATVPEFQFSKTAVDVVKRARSLAEETGRAGVTSSCLLFAFADRAESQPDTSRFVRDALDHTGGYEAAFEKFRSDSGNASRQSASDGGELLGKISSNMREVLNHAATFAERVSGRSAEIHQRHLFAALLATPEGERPMMARTRLKNLGVELPELCREFRGYIQTHASHDNAAEWDAILGASTSPRSESKSGSNERLREGELTLNQLFAETRLGKAMEEADRNAFRVGAALAQELSRPELNSMGVLAGYLLTAKHDSRKSEGALAKAAWSNFAANHSNEVKADAVEMWRIVHTESLDQLVKYAGENSALTGDWKLSAGLRQMLLRSCEVAKEAGRSQDFSTRHLLACLLGPREWSHDPEGAAEIREKVALDLPAVRRAFRDWTRQSRTDNAEVIDDVLGLSADDTEGTVSPPSDSLAGYQKTYSSFIPDRAAYGRRKTDDPLDDALGVGVYAGHLAQLIAAKETWMPLSIGLFGAWGSGKSHFIDLLDEQLRSLMRAPGKVFHPQIVQIRFNAWHYLDTNLWANLVCEIFDQLFVKLDERPDTTAAQVDKLKGELAKQSALAAEAKEALRTAESARVEAEARLRTAMQERLAEEGKVGKLLNDLKNLVIDEKVRKQLREAAEGLGIPKLETSFAELEARAGEVRSLNGRTKALALAVFTGPGGWRRGLLLAVALAAPLAVAWLAEHGTASMQQMLAGAGRTIAQVVAAITALSTWLSSQVKAGNSLVGKLESAYDQVKKVRAEREAKDDAAQAQKALSVKRQAEEEARHTLREAEEKMKGIRAELAELAPGRQLIRFLKERASAEDYRRHLGLVSLVRKDFEQLSQLLIKAAEDKDASLPQIDRIVLYIDDLDRCRADRVIEVLEAVHLLLAFPLFAVVVAVDPRWLRQSLLDHYPRLLGGANERVTRTRRLGQPATPQDYLEKIFQVPFNLQAMEKTGFEALVKHLFPIAETKATQPTQETTVPLATPPAVSHQGSTLATPAPAPAPKAAENPSEPSSPPTSTTPPETVAPKTLPPDPQRLMLTKKEVTDVQRFQPLFQTPRAVKRLANTYSLIRVGVDEGDWNAYLGPNETPGIYRVPMLLLAATAAFPALARPWLLWLLETPPTEWILAKADITALVAKHADTTDVSDWDRLARCLKDLKLEGWPAPDPKTLEKWVPRVARYSF